MSGDHVLVSKDTISSLRWWPMSTFW